MTKAWPADRVERWPVAKLVPNARNARTHSDEQVAQLAASIEEWGWTYSGPCRRGGRHHCGARPRYGGAPPRHRRRAGYGRRRLERSKKRAYMLADNKLTLNAEWDLDRLAIEIAELSASDFDISLIGCLQWGDRRRAAGGAGRADGQLALRVSGGGAGRQFDRNQKPGAGEPHHRRRQRHNLGQGPDFSLCGGSAHGGHRRQQLKPRASGRDRVHRIWPVRVDSDQRSHRGKRRVELPLTFEELTMDEAIVRPNRGTRASWLARRHRSS